MPRRFQRLILDFVQVIGLYYQQAERTLQGDGFRERPGNFETLFSEERVTLIGVAYELAFLRDGFQTTRSSSDIHLIVETFITA